MVSLSRLKRQQARRKMIVNTYHDDLELLQSRLATSLQQEMESRLRREHFVTSGCSLGYQMLLFLNHLVTYTNVSHSPKFLVQLMDLYILPGR